MIWSVTWPEVLRRVCARRYGRRGARNRAMRAVTATTRDPGRRGAGVTAVIQGYRFALDPAPGQDAVLRSHCGGQRYAFDWGLALVTAVLGQR